MKLDLRLCPNCQKRRNPQWWWERSEMLWTRDCHGIPFRLVCRSCYKELMAKGYDGEYYTEADECID